MDVMLTQLVVHLLHMLHFVFSRSVSSNLMLNIFSVVSRQDHRLQCRKALGMRSCVADMTLQSFTSSVFFYKSMMCLHSPIPACEPSARTPDHHCHLMRTSPPHVVASAETAPCSSQDAGSASQCVPYVGKKKANVQSLPTNLWTVHERPDLSDILSHIGTHGIHIIDV